MEAYAAERDAELFADYMEAEAETAHCESCGAGLDGTAAWQCYNCGSSRIRLHAEGR